MSIFEPEHNIESFRGHAKKTNNSRLRILEKFEEMEHKVSIEILPKQILYTLYKKRDSETKSEALPTTSAIDTSLTPIFIPKSKDF